jgi:chaperonin GroES
MNKEEILESMKKDGFHTTEYESSAFPIQPMFEKVIIKPFPPEDISKGGIIIPETAKERPSKATIIAVGEGLPNIRPMIFKAGQVVFHIKGAGTEVQYNDESYYIIRDVEILAIFN